MQKGDEVGEQFLQDELIAQCHTSAAAVRTEPRKQVGNEPLAFFERLRCAVRQFAPPRCPLMQCACAAPGEHPGCAGDAGAEPVDPAVVAGSAAADDRVADEGAALLYLRFEEQPEVQRRDFAPREVRAGKQRNAQRTDGTGVGRDDDLAAGLPRHRRGQRVRRERHALAEDHLSHRPAAFDAVEVVLDDRVVEAGNDGVLGQTCPHGLVDDLCHEHRALLPQRNAFGRS